MKNANTKQYNDLEVGRAYKTRDGDIALIHAISTLVSAWPVFGTITDHATLTVWNARWSLNGTYKGTANAELKHSIPLTFDIYKEVADKIFPKPTEPSEPLTASQLGLSKSSESSKPPTTTQSGLYPSPAIDVQATLKPADLIARRLTALEDQVSTLTKDLSQVASNLNRAPRYPVITASELAAHRIPEIITRLSTLEFKHSKLHDAVATSTVEMAKSIDRVKERVAALAGETTTRFDLEAFKAGAYAVNTAGKQMLYERPELVGVPGRMMCRTVESGVLVSIDISFADRYWRLVRVENNERR